MSESIGVTLSGAPSGAGLSRTELLALLRTDQHRRWRQGDRVSVEDYLRHYPALADNAEATFDLVRAEVLLREGRGEAVQVEEYLGRFPAQAERLRRGFGLHQECL